MDLQKLRQLTRRMSKKDLRRTIESLEDSLNDFRRNQPWIRLEMEQTRKTEQWAAKAQEVFRNYYFTENYGEDFSNDSVKELMDEYDKIIGGVWWR